MDIQDWLLKNYDWLIILIIILYFTMRVIRYFTGKDEIEKEPKFKLIIAFLFGIISVVPAIILSILISNYFPTLSTSVVVAPVAEEIAKGLFVIILSWSRDFDGPIDGIVYGGLVGAGFAAAENLLYAIVALFEFGFVSGVVVASFRSVFQVVGHPFFTGLFGYGVGRAKVGLGHFKWGGVWKSILFHGLWNGVAGFGTLNFLLGLIGLAIIYAWYLKRLFSKALDLDRQAKNRGYYQKNSNVSYV